MGKNRFPKKDADFNDFLVIAVPYLVANATRLGISTDNVTILSDLYSSWTDTYPLSQDENTATKTIIDDKTALRASIEEHLRLIYGDIPQSVLTNADRNTLHLAERDTKPTARPKINTVPQVTVEAKAGRKMLVLCRTSSDANRASRHKDSNGVEYRYTVTPQLSNDLQQANAIPVPRSIAVTGISTKARFEIKLADEDAGKIINVECRWANFSDSSKSGPYSNPAQTMVGW